MIRKTAIAGACVVGAALALRCEDPPERVVDEIPELPDEPEWVPMPVALTDDQERGRALFESLCEDCHGEAGRGDGAQVLAGDAPEPPDLTTEERARRSADELERILEEEPLHPFMTEIVEAIQPEALREAVHFIPALVHPPEIPGSALAGRSLYQNRCVVCHGFQGRGDGSAVQRGLLYVDPPDLTTHDLVADRDFDELFDRVKEGGGPVHGSSMPTWRLALDDGDIWDLVAFMATLESDGAEPAPGNPERR